jgi:arylsulfatase
MRLPIAALSSGAVLVAALGPDLSPAEASAASPARPNVVFVLADDLGHAELGSYGQQKIRTPSLDRLAAQGMRFTQHYAGSAVCAPSRAVLMTGRHPGRNPIRDNRELQPEGQWPLPAPELTIAEVMKRLGYVTAAFGKWGLGPPGSEGDPLRQGFDHFFGYSCQRHAHDHYPDSLYDDTRRVATSGAYAPDLVLERARAFIRANQARPFFLYLPTTVPHLALQVPEDSLAEYRGLWSDPPYTGEKGYLPHPAPRAAYAAMVTRLDRDVGRILDLIRELGLEDQTIVVFTSDNGPTYDRTGGSDSEFFRSAGSLRGLKGSLYEGGLRVPAIVSWKGRVAGGRVSDRVTGFEDWLPTLVELVGEPAAIPPAIDGVSFAPTLRGAAQEPRPFLYRELAGYGGQQAVRAGDWKGVRHGLGTPGPPRLELYDLAADPSEALDVAARRPEVVARLEALIAREHAPSATFPLPAIDPPPARYLARRTAQRPEKLAGAAEAPWAEAERVSWGPEALATSFRALWSDAWLSVRFDVTDASPWHTLSARDATLWTEEVVELFLDVGATGRSYAEVEWNPAGTVVDLWVDRAEGRVDKGWDAAGLTSEVHARRDAAGRPSGWTVVSHLPWGALASRAAAGARLPPRAGDRWRFNVFRIERPFGPREPDRDALFLAWSPTGERSFHVPLAFREIEFAAE